MHSKVSDAELLQLLAGELSPSEEIRIENELAEDSQLRLRLDRLSGGDAWPIGSAPRPVEHRSDRLSKAIELVDRYLSRSTSEEMATKVTALPDPDFMDPPNIDGITLIRELGRGGMGVVYEGRDEVLGRRVAVKFIEPLSATHTEARQRFLREAQSTAALQHENIVSIYSIQNLNSRAALVQQYVDGCTLQERLDRRGALPIDECIDLARQMARGLGAAHAAGIVHRDLKPGNVLLEKDTGIARIADFGMAKRDADSQLTSPNVVSGTPAYMSPEQTKGEHTDGRSDLFSLGSILFAVTTGRPPFQGQDPFAVMHSVRHARVEEIKKLRPEVPDWFNQIVKQLLAKRPDDRIQSAAQLLNLLETKSAPISKWPRPAWLVAGAAMILSLAIATYVVWNGQVDRSTEPAIEVATPKIGASPRVISIVGQAQDYQSLARAVEAAQDGDTILVSADLETEFMEIVGKRLTIAAAPNCRPQLRPTEWAKEHSPILFRTDADLTIKGLVIEWTVKADLPITAGGKVNAVIVTVNNSNARLVLEDCALFRNGTGMCMGLTGDLAMDRCWVGGGEIAIGWLANQGRIQVRNSLLQCTTAISVIFPPSNISVSKDSHLTMEHCSVVGNSLFDFVIARIPERYIAVDLRNSVLDVERMTQLTAANSLNAFLNTELVANRILRSCVRWRETSCVHSVDSIYVACRRIRMMDRWVYTGISNLREWAALWPHEPTESPTVAGAVASKIASVLPADNRDVHWLGDGSLHRFDPPVELKVGPNAIR